MASSILPPNPCLTAILLVVKTTSEPRLVFHYPPKPGEDNSCFHGLIKDGELDDTSTTSSADEDASSMDEAYTVENLPVEQSNNHKPPNVEETDSISPVKTNGFAEKGPESHWNELFGYQGSTLARMLCPSMISHKKRVEIGLDGKVFLGQPMYAKPDGAWKKKKRKSRRTSSKITLPSTVPKELGEVVANDNEEVDADAVTDNEADKPQDSGFIEKGSLREADGNTISEKTVADEGERSEGALNMFHVSFILDPPPLEYHLRVKEMYDHVVKKVTKALRWEQARSGYVKREAAIIASTAKQLNILNGMTFSMIS